MDESSIHDIERQAIAFHARSCPEAENLWLEGINLLMRGLDPLSGKKTTSDEQKVLVALVISAWNSVYCAHSLAVRGYYTQALNLLRTPVEEWMAYWYLRSFPDEHVKFTKFQTLSDPSSKPPSFNDMLQRVETKNNQPASTEVRDWIKRLHPLSHISGSRVVLVVSGTEEGLHYQLGPSEDALAFSWCVSEAATITCALLEAVDNLRQLLGVNAAGVWQGYLQRVKEWESSFSRSVEE